MKYTHTKKSLNNVFFFLFLFLFFFNVTKRARFWRQGEGNLKSK